MSNSAGVSRIAEDANLPVQLVHAPSCFSGVRVAFLLLLLCMYYFGYFMFIVVCVCFHVWSLYLDNVFVDFRWNLGSLDNSLTRISGIFLNK